MVINAILLMPIPFLSRYIIDVCIPVKNYASILIIALAIFAVYIVQKLLGYFQGLFFYKVNRLGVIRLRALMLKKLYRVQDAIRRRFSSSYLTMRVDADTENLNPLFADRLALLLQDILYFIVGVISMIFLSKKLSIIVLASLLLYVLEIAFYKDKLTAAAQKNIESNAVCFANTEECIQGLRTSVLFQNPSYLFSKFFRYEKNTFKTGIFQFNMSMKYSIILSVISYIPYLTSLLVGASLIINNQWSLGSMLAFQSFIAYVFDPVTSIMNYISSLQSSKASISRIQEVFSYEEEPSSSKISMVQSVESIEFKNVSFAYDSNKILTNITFSMRKNEKVALVGPSGSGKSTIVALLLGLIRPLSGEILINNICADQSLLIKYRSRIKLIEQEGFLFDSTVEDNMKLVLSCSNLAQIKARVALEHFEAYFPCWDDVYHNRVGPNGNKLSGGEKQLVCLLRCLLTNPDIMILDETTSNVDEDREDRVLKYLLESGCGIIMITHRSRNLNRFDKVIFIESGIVTSQRVNGD
jgi:ABC-type bacteriocin/lantibiotic exporter with double-glycine peptidase domain